MKELSRLKEIIEELSVSSNLKIKSELQPAFCNKNEISIDDYHSLVVYISSNHETIVAKAERYGGEGIGGHGGGVRCGNYSGYQIKGAGSNILSGVDVCEWHSHGTLNVVDAFLETISSIWLNKISPLGASRCYGFMLTGEADSYYVDVASDTATTGWGAILIREVCVRPAHLLPCPGFRPANDVKYVIPSDISRIRQTYKKLSAIFDTDNEFVMFLGKILKNNAKQFAFTLMNRIAHGTLSASNMELEGRWLDLTNVSFLPAGMNIQLAESHTKPFLDEYKAPIQVLNEIIYNFNKFNDKKLRVKVLQDYYLEQYDAYCKYYMPYVLGINPESTRELMDTEGFTALFDHIYSTLVNSREIKAFTPHDRFEDDPFELALIELFALIPPNTNLVNGAVSNLKQCSDVDLEKPVNQIFQSAYLKRESSAITYKSFVISAALTAFKRAYYRVFFFRQRLMSAIEPLCINGKGMPDEIQDLSEKCAAVCDWFYESGDENDDLILFSSNNLKIYFQGRTGKYIKKYSGEERFDNFGHLVEALSLMEESKLTIGKTCFRDYLILMQGSISTLERQFDTKGEKVA